MQLKEELLSANLMLTNVSWQIAGGPTGAWFTGGGGPTGAWFTGGGGPTGTWFTGEGGGPELLPGNIGLA